MLQENVRKMCPEDGGELDRHEDAGGVSWQCHNYSCLSVFDDDEDLEDFTEAAS
jgi:ssDNA-binding Zn-finger/Zn-ribbon topoisomerase 1